MKLFVVRISLIRASDNCAKYLGRLSIFMNDKFRNIREMPNGEKSIKGEEGEEGEEGEDRMICFSSVGTNMISLDLPTTGSTVRRHLKI